MKFKFGNLFKESNIERKEIIKMKKDLEEQDCFVEASNEEKMTMDLTTLTAAHTLFSRFQHRFNLKTDLSLKGRGRTNKTVKHLTSYRPNVLTTSNNVTAFSPFTSHVSRAKRSAAFTLAEVLITLGIIGVVAAMTMPTLIQKHQKKVFVTKMKYTYSVLDNAFIMARQEHGDPKDWDWGKGVTKENTFRMV